MRELEEEVGRLKRELAEANARAWPERGMGRPIPVVDAVSPSVPREGVGKAVPVARDGVPCIHGGWYGRCRVLGCGPKSEREIQAEERERAKAAVARANR